MSRFRSLLWCLGTVALAAMVSFFVTKETMKGVSQPHDEGHTEASFHDWLHENLEITSEQEALLHPHEVAFEKDRERIRKSMQESGRDLANAIRDFEADSTEVIQMREKLTRLQGELQQVTLDHFFAMKEHLTQPQREKLLRWTYESIVHGYPD